MARALAASPAHGKLSDIEHVVILIQENRSFDSYFGMFPGVRGFGDRKGRNAFFQKGQDGRTVQPFHFATGCMSDITHDWAPQHVAYNGGKMDRFLAAHQADTANAAAADETMGYYDRADIPLYYALADKFTICDALPLLGDRPDRPQPADVDVRVDRSPRDARGTARADRAGRPHRTL